MNRASGSTWLALSGDAEEPAEKLEAVRGALELLRDSRQAGQGEEVGGCSGGALDREAKHLAPQGREDDRRRLGRHLLELEARRGSLAGEGGVHEVDGLGHPRQRLRERHVVPALDDAVRRCADAEREPPVGEIRERRGLLREQRRPAGEDTDHSGPEPRALGPRRGRSERGEPVGPVGLAAPQVGVAGRLRATDQVGVVAQWQLGEWEGEAPAVHVFYAGAVRHRHWQVLFTGVMTLSAAASAAPGGSLG